MTWNGNKLDLVRLAEGAKAKSRLHVDFRPADQGAEVARLTAHGPRRAGTARRDASGFVLADPEETSSASSRRTDAHSMVLPVSRGSGCPRVLVRSALIDGAPQGKGACG
ncbi:VOC family protein [Intrasporangium sp.]|uniref:VOC family protein n=1 Tax=Intrasporangium sp. TaxID=1925024 RepID=UPI0039774B80